MSANSERLLELALERGAIKYGDFTLTSGMKSSYYFDGRLLSLDPEGANLIVSALLPLLWEAGAEAVGGTTLGADPIVASVALASYREGPPIPAFIVRKESKEHGTRQEYRGPADRREQSGHRGRRLHHRGFPFPRHRGRRGGWLRRSQGGGGLGPAGRGIRRNNPSWLRLRRAVGSDAHRRDQGSAPPLIRGDQ